MTIDPHTPVGQIVGEHLDRARIFDRLSIDYCCRGDTPLDQACARKSLDSEAVLRELAACDAERDVADEMDYKTMPLSDLAARIVATHHAYLHRELPRLNGLMAKVIDAHAERHPELHDLRDVLKNLTNELESHMLKEERFLFPMIQQLESASTLPHFHCGSINNSIFVMEHENATTGSALERMRALTGGYVPPGDACTIYRALLQGLAALEMDLHRHIHNSTVSDSAVAYFVNSNPLAIAVGETCPSAHTSGRSSTPHYAAARA